jgi:hypothetical protein
MGWCGEPHLSCLLSTAFKRVRQGDVIDGFHRHYNAIIARLALAPRPLRHAAFMVQAPPPPLLPVALPYALEPGERDIGVPTQPVLDAVQERTVAVMS